MLLFIVILLAFDSFRITMEECSPEYTVIKNCTSILENALKENRDIVHFLERKNFITEDTHDYVLGATCPLTPLQKSWVLVKKIRDKVKINTQNFYILLEEFKCCKDYYLELIAKLELEMENQNITISPHSNRGKNC